LTGHESPEDIMKIGELVTYATRLQKIANSTGADGEPVSSPVMVAPGSPAKRRGGGSKKKANKANSQITGSSSVTLPPVPGAEPRSRSSPSAVPEDEAMDDARRRKLEQLKKKFRISEKKKAGAH
jgi:hypothetical protein